MVVLLRVMVPTPLVRLWMALSLDDRVREDDQHLLFDGPSTPRISVRDLRGDVPADAADDDHAVGLAVAGDAARTAT